ncbi:MAG: hypothetical protein KBH94_03285 [Caldisericia bacterium]|nr:hypothetical protein [Caldisericia bacterium]
MTNRKTPVYIYDQNTVNQNIEKFNIFTQNNIDVFYAVKANNYEPLVKSCIEAGYGFDVASIEELTFLLSLGANPLNISFSAPTKLERDIKQASDLGVRMFAFDSETEIRKILKNAKDPLLVARITAHNEDAIFNLSVKFGMDIKYSEKILKKASKRKWPVAGVTFHIGSQNNSVISWKKALDGVQLFIDNAKKYNLNIWLLNIGGGIPAKYTKNIKDSSFYIERICKYVDQFKRKNKNIKRVIIEPGRSLSANTMNLITKVINIKEYKKPPLVIVDTSVFNGLIEPLEHLEYGISSLNDGRERTKLKYYRVAGMSCDGYDIINKRCLLPKDLKTGDYLLIENTGAYTFVYEHFHMKKFPDIVNK